MSGLCGGRERWLLLVLMGHDLGPVAARDRDCSRTKPATLLKRECRTFPAIALVLRASHASRLTWRPSARPAPDPVRRDAARPDRRRSARATRRSLESDRADGSIRGGRDWSEHEPWRRRLRVRDSDWMPDGGRSREQAFSAACYGDQRGRCSRGYGSLATSGWSCSALQPRRNATTSSTSGCERVICCRIPYGVEGRFATEGATA